MNCRRDADCRQADGYMCDADSTCYPGEGDDPGPVDPPPAGEGTVGDPCAQDGDCAGPGARCIPQEDGEFIGGYCVNFGCSDNQPCPAGAGCFQLQDGETVCLATCDDVYDC